MSTSSSESSESESLPNSYAAGAATPLLISSARFSRYSPNVLAGACAAIVQYVNLFSVQIFKLSNRHRTFRQFHKTCGLVALVVSVVLILNHDPLALLSRLQPLDEHLVLRHKRVVLRIGVVEGLQHPSVLLRHHPEPHLHRRHLFFF